MKAAEPVKEGPVVTKLKAFLKAKPPRAWLMKTEPETYSIDRLAREKKTDWEGVRNYQARNFMTDCMQVGDLVLVYHSNATPPGFVGTARVSRGAEADASALDRKSPYHDPKATREKPIWQCVQVAFKSKFPRMVTLAEAKADPKLSEMLLIMPGQRLSIQPLSKAEAEHIMKLAKTPSAT